MVTVAYILVNLYGVFNFMMGISEVKSQKIPRWAATLLSVGGGVIVLAGIYVLLFSMIALILLIVGIIIVQIAALQYRNKETGKVDPLHQGIRIAVGVLLLVVSFMVVG